ncbi:MAG: hypothetical protein O3B84_03685 [Chloroflexi bacterium]|nr:hypothetical protein [Chloroflexota bacterium]
MEPRIPWSGALGIAVLGVLFLTAACVSNLPVNPAPTIVISDPTSSAAAPAPNPFPGNGLSPLPAATVHPVLTHTPVSLTPTPIAPLGFLSAPTGQPGVITTVAGGGSSDGGLATDANLAPGSLAVDASGDLFIVSGGRIRKIDASTRIITSVVGRAPDGAFGDGGQADNLSGVGMIVMGPAGNFFVGVGGRIRKVDRSTGVITTIAGSGVRAFSGDGGPAIDASLNDPFGLALDRAGNLFISDSAEHRVRMVDASTGIITTIAGDGTAGFSGDGGPAIAAGVRSPHGLALDGAGNLFVASTYGDRVRRVDASTGIITTVAGDGSHDFFGDGGPAIARGLRYPTGIAVDGAGNLFIADSDNERIRRVDAFTGLMTTVAGHGRPGLNGDGGHGTVGFSGDGGSATDASLNSPNGLALDATGNLFIADTANYRVRRVDASTGIITTVAGNGTPDFFGDGGPATDAVLSAPYDVAVDEAGNAFIADTGNDRIRRVDAATGVITTVAGSGARLLPGNQIEIFSGDGGLATRAAVGRPDSIAVDAAGNLFVAQPIVRRVRRVDASTGVITTVAGNGGNRFSGDGVLAIAATLSWPTDVVLDGAGNLFIADSGDQRVRRVDASTGVITTVAGNGGRGFSGDGGLATDAALGGGLGNVALDGAGNLFIANNDRVRRVEASTGIITTIAGNGTRAFCGDGNPATSASFTGPTSMVVDDAGNVFLSDHGGHFDADHTPRIRRVDAATGIISTVAGNGIRGFSGDSGAATEAMLNFPSGLALDGNGNLFIADTGNGRVRRVEGVGVGMPSGPPIFDGAPRSHCIATDPNPTPIPTPPPPPRIPTPAPSPRPAALVLNMAITKYMRASTVSKTGMIDEETLGIRKPPMLPRGMAPPFQRNYAHAHAVGRLASRGVRLLLRAQPSASQTSRTHPTVLNGPVCRLSAFVPRRVRLS